MTTILALREPFRTFFAQLDKVHFGVSSYTPSHIEIGGHWVYSIPDLDPDEARQLANELEAAITPVMKRFKERKLQEVIALLSPATATAVESAQVKARGLRLW